MRSYDRTFDPPALDFVVLGRDMLNDFYLLLSGPELTFDLSASPLNSGA